MKRIDTMKDASESENLLDWLPRLTDSDCNVHTFSEFKDWINKFEVKSFVPLEKIEPIRTSNHAPLSQSAVDSSSLNRRYSGSPHKRKNSDDINVSFITKRRSLNSQKDLELIEEGRELETSTIEAVNQNKQDKIRRRRRTSDHLHIGFQLTGHIVDFETKEGQSSRSFNGFEQINQYELTEQIGRGAFSRVYKGIDTETRAVFAIKIMSTKDLKKKLFFKRNSLKDGNRSELKSSLSKEFVNNEVALLKKISSPYITKLEEVIVDEEKQKIYLVLEYCAKGYINQSQANSQAYRKLLESECRRYYKQLALAIDYLHNMVRIAHRDIKPQNILISNYDEIKLSDFGLGTDQLEDNMQSGTRLYMPPESRKTGLKKNIKTQAGDIWAIGVTLLILLTGKTPNYDKEIDIDTEVSNLKDVSDECREFLKKCLEEDPEERLTAGEMLRHPWLSFGEIDLLRSSCGTNSSYKDIVVTFVDQQNALKEIVQAKPGRGQVQINIFS